MTEPENTISLYNGKKYLLESSFLKRNEKYKLPLIILKTKKLNGGKRGFEGRESETLAINKTKEDSRLCKNEWEISYKAAMWFVVRL